MGPGRTKRIMTTAFDCFDAAVEITPRFPAGPGSARKALVPAEALFDPF